MKKKDLEEEICNMLLNQPETPVQSLSEEEVNEMLMNDNDYPYKIDEDDYYNDYEDSDINKDQAFYE